MPRGHAGSSAVAIVALACLLLASTCHRHSRRKAAISRRFGKRSSSGRRILPPLRPTIRSLPTRSRWARSCSPTRASPATASARAPPVIGPKRTFTDGRRRALALSGAPLRRNTPSLWNLAWSKQFFWDGRAPSLEAQVRMPIEEAQEMGGDWPQILRRLGADADLAARVPRRLPRGAAASRRPPSSRRSHATCARSSRRRPGSMPGSTATRRR